MKRSTFFSPLGCYDLSHALMERHVVLSHVDCSLIITGTRTLQESQMGTAGSWISWRDFWNRQIVCLHTGRKGGTDCTTIPRFLANNREKDGIAGSWFGTPPEEFPVYRECPATRGQKEIPWIYRERRLRCSFLIQDKLTAALYYHYYYCD